MSLDVTKFAAWAQQVTGGVSVNRQLLVSMEEGVKGSERSRDDTVVQLLDNATEYLEYSLPIAVGTVIPANTKFLVSLRGIRTTGTNGYGLAKIVIDGGTTYTSSAFAAFGASAVTQTNTVTVTSAATVAVGVTVQVFNEWVTSAAPFDLYYLHDDCHVGIDSTTTGILARTQGYIVPISLGVGSHANPTAIDGPPEFTIDINYAYAADSIYIIKIADTLKTAAHSAGATSLQDLGAVSTNTDAFPALSSRRMTLAADTTRKPDALTNTYYNVVTADGTSYPISLYWETRLAVEQPTLATLNGTSGTPVVTTSVAPTLSWTHTNTAATHHRIKVYDASDDSLDHDSGEIAGAAMQGSYNIDGADLADTKTYYAKVTVMNGSGGSTWTVDSIAGYFTVDWAATGVKITSHEGSVDTPEVIVTRAPTVTWAFLPTQTGYNVTAIDAADNSVEYATGWVVSATKSVAFPANELDLGHTYSIQVQVKDSHGSIYTADKRAWVHVNESSIPAPALTAEADCTTADSVTLEWAASSVGDGDTLTYSVEITPTIDSVVQVATTYDAGSGLSLLMHRLQAGSYSWRVRATDEHSLAGTWAAADVFVVSQAGNVPTVTLVAITPNVNTTPVSQWHTIDLDGDAQSDYQVQIDNNADFLSITQDSGVVASTNMYHAHTTLATGTWYRRVKVRTASTDWSGWVDDSFQIVAATAQTALWEVYLDAEGTPTALDLATYPISGVWVTRPFDGATTFGFTVDNFNGTQGGIDDDEEMLLYLKDTAGNLLQFRGGGKGLIEKTMGLMCEVTCTDIAGMFGRWKVTIDLDHATMAEIIEAMIENPTGSAATGIVAHVQECEDPETPGMPISFKEWSGQDKTVLSWLGEFQKLTGFRWYTECLSGTWHFYWLNGESLPNWAITLKDDIDYSAESASQWRVLDGTTITKTWAEYANRIRYNANYDPPALPPGIDKWDTLLTEASTNWGAYSGATLAEDATIKFMGTKSISFTVDTVGGAGGTALPRFANLGYVKVPAPYRDFENAYLSGLNVRIGMRSYLNDAAYVSGTNPDGSTFYGYGGPWIEVKLYSGSDVGPTGGLNVGYGGIGMKLNWDLNGPDDDDHWERMRDVPLNVFPQYAVRDGSSFDANNVHAIGFRLVYPGNATYQDSIIANGSTFRRKVWIDNLGFMISKKPSGRVMSGEFYVETAAVTAGTEVPVEAELNNNSMSQTEARSLALTWLDIKNVVKTTVGTLALAGVRTIPMQVQVPIALTNGPVITAAYPLAQVEWHPDTQGGWQTVLTLGDMPSDLGRAIERIGHGFKNLSAEAQQ